MEAQVNQAKLQALRGNLDSFCTILDDVIEQMRHQILGNCKVLLTVERRSDEKHGNSSDAKNIFREDQVDSLVVNPINLSIGRLRGIKNRLSELRDSI